MKKVFDSEYVVTTDSPPDVPTLEITTKIGCNVNCKYCPQNLLMKKYIERSNELELSFDNFKKCIDKLPKNVIICFAGFSEPFLSPFTTDMMNYVYDNQREISLFTTLVGLTVEKFEKIRYLPFRKVVIHLPDEKNFANIPLTKEYLHILEIIINTKKNNGSCFVDKMTCQSPPKQSILKMVKNKFHISWNMTDRAGNLQYSELITAHDYNGKIKCRLSNHNHNVLLPNGDVVLCSMDFGLKHVLGNLLHEDYLDLMNSSMMEWIESASKSSTDSLLCRRCSEAIPI